MKKTVAITANTSWNLYNFRLNLAEALKKNGYRVVLIAPYDQYSMRLQQEYEYYPLYMNNKGTNPLQDLKTLMEFYRAYKHIRPDIVLSYTIKPNIYGNIACRLLNITNIANISGLGTAFIQESFLTKIVRWLYKYALKHSSKVFFQNSDDQELFIEYQLVSQEKTAILPGSGVDTKTFFPKDKTDGTNHFRFLLIARMIRDKGIHEYVEAARIIKKSYPEVEFQLLGSHDAINPTAISIDQIQTWVDAGLVVYLGSTDNVKEFIKNADSVVLPSYREGTPRSLLESASMEKPLIASNVPGCREVIDDGVNGYLCQAKDSADLADKMFKLLKLSNSERKKMGNAGRAKIIKEYDEKIVISQYLSIIKENIQ